MRASNDAEPREALSGQEKAVEEEGKEEGIARLFKGGGYYALMVLLVAVLLIESLISLGLGQYVISPQEVLSILYSHIAGIPGEYSQQADSVIFSLRIPRILGAILVGAALALAGLSFQSVFRNPLVSPDLLGVSSGACVGASLAILLHFTTASIQVFAFVFGLVTVLCTVSIPKLLRNSSMAIMVLAGIIMSGVMTSLLGLIKYLADPETELAAITYWQLGSLSKVTAGDLVAIAPVIVIAAGVILAIRWRINILTLGEGEARSLGVNVKLTRGAVILCSTLLTACSVCVCGTVGWVGLVIPHVSRMLVGPDNVQSMPACILLGAIFMLLIDTIARVLTTMDLPLGMLTGLVGAPFFLFVLLKQRMRLS